MPAEIPFTNPEVAFTVAMPGLPLLQEPPMMTFERTDVPAVQMLEFPVIGEMLLTEKAMLTVHPLGLV